MKKTVKIVLRCVIAALLVSALLYLVPWVTPVDLTLDAVKLDSDGNEVGTEQLRIKGYRYDYLFQIDRLDVTVSPLELKPVTSLRKDSVNGVGVIYRYEEPLQGFLQVAMYGVSGEQEDMDFDTYNLYFTEEFDRFALVCFNSKADKYHYVASVSGEYTAQELVEYFNRLPGL